MTYQGTFSLPDFQDKKPVGIKFKITTVANTYSKDQKEKLEKLGLTFEKNDQLSEYYQQEIYQKAFQETMDDRELPVIEISSLAELMRLAEDYDDLIITATRKITIYDDSFE